MNSPGHISGLSDTEFASRFANCTLDPGVFDHTAHVRLAWIYLTRYPMEEAIAMLCDQIAAFDARFGDGTKFHCTLTVAAARVVQYHIERSDAQTFEVLISEFPRLIGDFNTLILAHYSKGLLSRPEAKHTALPPDLLPFPE